MSFGSNKLPSKFGKGKEPPSGRKPWLCGCGITQSKFVLYCSRCNRGQAA